MLIFISRIFFGFSFFQQNNSSRVSSFKKWWQRSQYLQTLLSGPGKQLAMHKILKKCLSDNMNCNKCKDTAPRGQYCQGWLELEGLFHVTPRAVCLMNPSQHQSIRTFIYKVWFSTEIVFQGAALSGPALAQPHQALGTICTGKMLLLKCHWASSKCSRTCKFLRNGLEEDTQLFLIFTIWADFSWENKKYKDYICGYFDLRC